jgi:hypothetical protein
VDVEAAEIDEFLVELAEVAWWQGQRSGRTIDGVQIEVKGSGGG